MSLASLVPGTIEDAMPLGPSPETRTFDLRNGFVFKKTRPGRRGPCLLTRELRVGRLLRSDGFPVPIHYGITEIDGTRGLLTELVEGPSLYALDRLGLSQDEQITRYFSLIERARQLGYRPADTMARNAVVHRERGIFLVDFEDWRAPARAPRHGWRHDPYFPPVGEQVSTAGAFL